MADHPRNPEIRLLDGQFYLERPLEHYRWMRQHAPVCWDDAGKVWGVALHEDIMAVSRDPAAFCSRMSSRPDSPALPSMINLDDPEHKRRRNLVNKGFTPRRVEDHEPKIRAICRELIGKVAARGECEFVREIAAPLPMIVIGDMLGIAPEDRDMLLRWSDDMISATNAQASPEVQMKAAVAAGEYFQYAARVIADRRANPTDDLISVLVHAEIDGERLSDEELFHESLLILVGGDETTRHVITGGMQALCEHPAERAKLVGHPERIPTAVEELLRWVTPIVNMNRTATRDVDKVLLLYKSGNRDERVFRDPDRLDVSRDPNDHVAFGGYGAHFCLGSSLARLELRVMFEELLAALPDLELASDAPLSLRPSNFIVGIEHMPVRFTPRRA
jgi:cytochrome P450 family 142 subfamily A polypeptide 1